MRPGRLDRIIYVGPPGHAGRVEILTIKTRKMSVDPEFDPDEIAAIVCHLRTVAYCRVANVCRPLAVLVQKSLRYVKKRP